MKNKIPKKFYRGDNKPRANTVGELKKIINELPDDLPLDPHENGCSVVVYNVDSNIHACVEANWAD